MLAGPSSPAEGRSDRRRRVLILVAVLVLLAAGGAAAVLRLGGGKPAEAAGGSGSEERAVRSLVAFDSFVVNLADPYAERYLKATIRAVLDDPELARELQRDELLRARVRDRIISVLTSKTSEQVTAPGGKDSLRQQLQREINQALPDDAVSEVLFVDFIVQ